ncbi:IucA/IucC family protein [Musicola keenii]|uniref:IucA/IucC family protein n=1 Tax=Musicola keenii TaxID=2884250 RepID=UPI001784E841|nr:IucA/IucC family protein [Musicola keenii]
MFTSFAAHKEHQPASTPPSPLREAAEYETLTALLNCYIREFALPARRVHRAACGNIPQALNSKMIPGEIIVIELTASEKTLAIKADRWSLLARGRYSSAPFVKQFGKPWRAISAAQTLRLIQEEMAAQLEQPFNHELAQQIENSIDVTQDFLAAPPSNEQDGFIRSEQGLLWGHPLHPSPKSRSGVTRDALLACSPEVGAHFPLYWFRIDPQLLQHQGDAQAPIMLETLAGEPHLYPCHPWEVEHIRRAPLYQQAERLGLITPVGPRGLAMYPTSSVRTLYRAGLPYFLKCSIHVRLTNCVRKNAWYELESAVRLSEQLNDVFNRIETRVPGFRIMREPAATSLDFSAIATPEQRPDALHLQECFGLLYRENLPDSADVALAGALFAWDRHGDSQIAPLIQHVAETQQLTRQQATLRWFDAYLTVLLPGVLGAFFDEGIVFEPHLQNTLIGLQDALPHRIWVRDLEGTKLDPARWPAASLAAMSERARQSVYYPREKGWQRIAYCLLINNLSEAVFHLAAGDRTLERQLWQTLSVRLESWRDQPEIAALLAGAPIPSKNNLRTRLLQRADKQADYTLIHHPMRSPA